MNKYTVHVFSVIPHLSELLLKGFPNINVKTVDIKSDVSTKYEKIVTNEELEQLKDAKIILSDGHLIAQVYHDLKQTEWVQCTWAGVDKVVYEIQKSCIYPTFTLTRMVSSSFSQLMAEYTIGWILNHERGWLDAREYQKQSVWAHKDKIATFRSLKNLTIGVLGIGIIGSEVVQALKYFNCSVYGLGRSEIPPEGLKLDKYFCTSELPLMMKECDYLVNILPSTPDTINILGGDILKFANKQPVLINIGRGDVIAESDILNALDKKWISAAILDVFEKEPLPKESELWSRPNVIVTPHAAGVCRAEDVIDSFSSNFDRYLKGTTLENIVQWDRGY